MLPYESSSKDLAKLCLNSQPEIRSKAAITCLDFSGDATSQNVLLSGNVHLGLAKLITLSKDEDEDIIGSAKGSAIEFALKALTNLTGGEGYSDRGPIEDVQIIQSLLRLKPSLITSLIDRLRDDDLGGRGAAVMLLVNLTRISSLKPMKNTQVEDENNNIDSDDIDGCSQLLTDGGIGLRRLVQLLLQPVKAGSIDEFEHGAHVLANLSQLSFARSLLLSPEKRLLPSLLPLLQAPSDARRRGIAFMIRNCVLDSTPECITYLLSESVQLVTCILIPLAGDASLYRADEREAMPTSISGFDSEKKREGDVLTRRALVESLRVLAARSKEAREHMRAIKVYPVIKAFHEWLETDAQKVLSASTSRMVDKNDTTLLHHQLGNDVVDNIDANRVVDTVTNNEDAPLGEDDEKCVEAINVLVQQLWREDEVITPPSGPLKLEKSRPRRGGGENGGSKDVFQEREDPLITMPTVALDKAHEIAKRIANNPTLSDDDIAAWNSKSEASKRALESLGLD